jgi:hypothetical protein
VGTKAAKGLRAERFHTARAHTRNGVRESRDVVMTN